MQIEKKITVSDLCVQLFETMCYIGLFCLDRAESAIVFH